jgi:acyl carrier protein
MPGGEAGRHGARPGPALERVLDVVRALARETGGPRAERAVSAEASLEREVGLGSLERVELLARLERAFGRALDDRCLGLDTAAGLAGVLGTSRPRAPARSREAPAPPPTSVRA